MKSKTLLSISVGVSLLLNATAQTNGPSEKQTAGISQTSPYQKMLDFLSADFSTIKNAQPIDEAMKVNQGESHLVVPTRGDPSQVASASTMSYDRFLPSVFVKEPLQGSPFLLNYYVQGLVQTANDSILDKPDYLYNYDKMSGNFLLKKTIGPPIAVDRELVKSFCLKMDKGGYIFERVPFINSEEFFQVINKGPRYAFYKLYKNKLVYSNSQTNGYMAEGNNYDEYQDVVAYYLVDYNKKESVLFELKKYSIRKALASDVDVVNHYFKEHKVLDIDDEYLASLGKELNK